MTTSPIQPKLIYLTRRHPALSRPGFTDRWRQHAELGMSRPRWSNIARYAHCDIVEPPAELRDVLSDHDGIGLIWHRSPAHRRAHLADTTSRAEMEADELATFAEPIVRHCLVARESTRLAPPAQTGGAAKLTCFHWSYAPGGREPSASVDLQGLVGHLVSEPLPPERPSGWGLSCNVIEEFWFGSQAEAVQGARALARVPGRNILVLSNQIELYRAAGDDPNFAPAD
jgi:hypothetical protein